MGISSTAVYSKTASMISCTTTGSYPRGCLPVHHDPSAAQRAERDTLKEGKSATLSHRDRSLPYTRLKADSDVDAIPLCRGSEWHCPHVPLIGDRIIDLITRTRGRGYNACIHRKRRSLREGSNADIAFSKNDSPPNPCYPYPRSIRNYFHQSGP